MYWRRSSSYSAPFDSRKITLRASREASASRACVALHARSVCWPSSSEPSGAAHMSRTRPGSFCRRTIGGGCTAGHVTGERAINENGVDILLEMASISSIGSQHAIGLNSHGLYKTVFRTMSHFHHDVAVNPYLPAI